MELRALCHELAMSNMKIVALIDAIVKGETAERKADIAALLDAVGQELEAIGNNVTALEQRVTALEQGTP